MIIMTKKEFEDIYRQHFAKMYRLARTMLYDADESKDVVSDIFARLLREKYQPQQNQTEGYLMTATTKSDGRLPDDCRAQPLPRRAQPQVDAGTGGKAFLAGVDAEPDRFDE